jgi:hypothetical protein
MFSKNFTFEGACELNHKHGDAVRLSIKNSEIGVPDACWGGV